MFGMKLEGGESMELRGPTKSASQLASDLQWSQS